MQRDRGVVAVGQKCIPAGRTEVDSLGVAVPAVGTEHRVHGTPPRTPLLLAASGPWGWSVRNEAAVGSRIEQASRVLAWRELQLADPSVAVWILVDPVRVVGKRTVDSG